MGRPKKKPKYNSGEECMRLLIDVMRFYGEFYDDRLTANKNHISLRDVAEHFRISHLKARKILITGNIYSTVISRRVQELYNEGKCIQEIVKLTGLSQASVNSYLPYDRIIYNIPELSVDAERKKLQRIRVKECKSFIESMYDMPTDHMENELWRIIEMHRGCFFVLRNEEKFRFHIKNNEIHIYKSEDIVMRDSVMIALHKTTELKGCIENHEMLGVVSAQRF